MKIANASGLAMTVFWIVCTAFVWLLPDFSMTVTSWWMHGMDVSVLGRWNLTMSSFLLGGVSAVVSAWVVGYLFAWALEKTSK